MDQQRWQRVVLLGLPGSGKSTVGQLLADRLGWRFIDFDAEIVRRTGNSIDELFANAGERAFRRHEAELTAELCSLPQAVLAPGGGWAAVPGLLEALPAGSARVWLRVSPDEAIRRLRGNPVVRPLLAGTDPLAAMRGLAEQRNDRYARADLVVDVDGRGTAEIADTIVAWLRPDIS